MKVRIAVTVEVDADAWADEYGTELSEVRKDVNDWARSHLIEALRDNGVAVDS